MFSFPSLIPIIPRKDLWAEAGNYTETTLVHVCFSECKKYQPLLTLSGFTSMGRFAMFCPSEKSTTPLMLVKSFSPLFGPLVICQTKID